MGGARENELDGLALRCGLHRGRSRELIAGIVSSIRSLPGALCEGPSDRSRTFGRSDVDGISSDCSIWRLLRFAPAIWGGLACA